MITRADRKSWFNRLSPLAALLVATLSLTAADRVPFYVQASAIFISFLLVATWLVSLFDWNRLAISLKWRRALRKDLKMRLQTLLHDTASMMSDSYTHSPFYVWHEIANMYPEHIRKCHAYQWSVGAWIQDLSEKQFSKKVRDLVIADSLSKAISELSKLTQMVERDLEDAFRLEDRDQLDRKRLLRQWDVSRHHFNGILENWVRLFGEINAFANINCTTYFRRLEMVEQRFPV